MGATKMNIKPISFLTIALVGMTPAVSSYGVPMTAQIQHLLEQKEEKIKKLEECEGKKWGWKIAGISTIGLTAVGIGVNIAQANKSNRLSEEIDLNKQQLERQQKRLDQMNTQISQKEQEKAEGGYLKEENSRQKGVESEIVKSDYADREPDGKVGDACDNGKGTWVPGGDQLCLDVGGNGLQYCHCKTNTDNDNDGKDKKSIQDNGDVVIAGYCLNQEGDTGDLDYSKKTFCWCDIYIPNYCSQSKLFDDNIGVCSGQENGNNTMCQTFCEGKKSALIKICDDLQ